MKAPKRYKQHDVLPKQIKSQFEGATKRLKTAKLIGATDEEAAYEMAYEAVLKASLAILYKNGVRPRSIPGHHIAILEKAQELIGNQVANYFRVFEEMRRNRNNFLYDADGFVTMQEVNDALELVSDYLSIVKKHLGL